MTLYKLYNILCIHTVWLSCIQSINCTALRECGVQAPIVGESSVAGLNAQEGIITNVDHWGERTDSSVWLINVLLKIVYCGSEFSFTVKGRQAHKVHLCHTYKQDRHTDFLSLTSSMWGLLRSLNYSFVFSQL